MKKHKFVFILLCKPKFKVFASSIFCFLKNRLHIKSSFCIECIEGGLIHFVNVVLHCVASLWNC